jgi:hypothetical protein
MRQPCLFAILLCGASLCPPLAAQQLPLAVPFMAPGTSGYNAAIPTPEDVIGHVVGERHTRPDQVVRYFEAVAASSPRVTVAEHGQTYEGRPLVHAIVTRPGRDLEAARLANQRLSDAPGGVRDAELDGLPVVAYMGYSVHGDEASGTEAALLLLYHLAAGQGPAIDDVLDNVVVIIDPMLNPDGRSRFVDWVNANRGGSGSYASLDPQDREHNQPWPRGRTNHYLFDLNRDWLPMQHLESQARMALWHDWRPQLTTDFHEMGGNSTYFFQPGIPSRNNPNTPELNYALTARLAAHHARALDRIGELYYSKEDFDDFYYGKGSTYPDIQGSVGILFEQASSRALAAETVNGRLDYAATVRNQFATSLSSLAGAVDMRLDLLRFMRDFYAGAPSFASRAATRAYVFDASGDPRLAADFVAMLGRSRIRVHELAEVVEAGGRRFEPGRDLVVPVDQPQAHLVNAVMERVLTFPDSLFYDVSTWTLPLAFGLEYAELARAPRLGEAVTALPAGGRLHGGRATYAYVIPWGLTAAPRALYRLQAAGARVRLMKDAFEATVGNGTHHFERGAIVVPVSQHDVTAETIHRLVMEGVEDGVDAYALASGLAVTGPDLGSSGARVLVQPSVALLAGEGTHVTGVGEVWHLLNERVGMPVSLVDLTALGTADLRRYTTIIMAERPTRQPGASELASLRSWVRGGGVLVAVGGAAGWAAGAELLDIEQREASSDTLEVPFEDVRPVRGAELIGGAIFEVVLDRSHPLAFGYPERVPVFKQGTQAFELSLAPGTTVGRYPEQPLISGYASAANLERISEGSAMVAQRQGRGAVVMTDFRPAFRAFWRGSEGLLLNAIFFGATF